jgi:tetratricopeptide (TPR) repeat protein
MNLYALPFTTLLLLTMLPLKATATHRQTATSTTDIKRSASAKRLHLRETRASKKRSISDIYFVEDELQETSSLYTRYLQAAYLHTRGKATDAYKAYQHILAQNPPPYAYEGFFRLLFDVGQFKNIVTFYERKRATFETAFKDNLEFQLLIAQAYLNTDQEAKAVKLFTALTEKYPDNEQVAYYTALSFIQNNQIEKALAFIDECLKKPILHSKHFLFYFLKSKIYLQQHEPAKALAMIEKSIEVFPKFDRGWLFKSILLEQQGKINEAISGYKKFLDIVGSEENVEKQLVQLLFSQKRYSEAAHYLKKMKSHLPEYHFDLALIEFKAENYSSALEHINLCLSKAPDAKQARLLKVEILLAQRNPQAALAFLHDWLATNPQDNLIVHTLLLLRNAGVSRADLIKTIEDVNRTHTPTLGILSALADLCVESGDYKKGIVYYHSIFNLTQDATLKSKILYHIAYVFFMVKDYKNLDLFIPKALKFALTSPNFYNLIAFYYVQTNQKLDQALIFIEKALATDQHSPYFLDTKGLILIKMGKKAEAIATLQKALDSSPNDSAILEHLALARE